MFKNNFSQGKGKYFKNKMLNRNPILLDTYIYIVSTQASQIKQVRILIVIINQEQLTNIFKYWPSVNSRQFN